MPSLNSRLLYLASLALLSSPAFAADWPLWRYDAQRSAVSPQTLPATLHLQWARKLPMLKTAWPDQPAMQFDDVYLPVLAGKMLYVGSSYHDTLTAYNTETGEEVWNVQADGPIRLAPVVHEGRVYFASDDSYLYCVDGAKGTLLWKFRGGPSDRKILGNERLISTWPARGGPVIADGTVYFAAGIWPFMGVFLHAVDARTGKAIWTNDGDSCIFIKQPHNADSFAGVAPQGSIVVAGDKLIVPGGRSVPACFDRTTGKLLYYLLADNGKRGGGSDVAATDKTFFSGGAAFDITTGKHLGAVPRQLVFTDSLMHGVEKEKLTTTDLATAQTKTEKTVDRLGKSTTIQRWSMETLGQVTSMEASDCIRAGDRIYVGGKGRILAHDLPLPKDPKAGPSWSVNLEGAVGCLLAGDDRLYAVTREGAIFCYGEKNEKIRLHEMVPPRDENAVANRKARSLLAMAGVRDGNAIIWGAGDGTLARAVVRTSDLEVVVIDSDPEKVLKQREEVRALGLSRERLAIHVADPLGIELPPYLASLMIVDPSTEIGPDLIQKMYHSLRPYGGVACISVPEGRHQELTRTIDRLKLPGAKVRSEGEWLLVSREGALPGSADWTHEHADAANTRVSRDKIVKAPLGVLWFGGQSHDGILPRHGHGPQPQVVGGRLFIEGVDMIRAMDVYTGRILWETPLPGVGHFYNNTAHQPGANSSGTNYISTADGIYVAYNQSCLRLDPATGKRLNSFPIPKIPGIEKNTRWGYINIVGDTIIGTLEPLFDPATKIVLDPKATDDDPPKKEEPKKEEPKTEEPKKDEPKKEEPKTEDPKKDDPKKDDSLIGKLIAKPPKAGTDNFSSSKYLVVMDRRTGKLLWSATSDLGFRHNTICAGGGRLYCIDRLSGPQEAKMKRRGETPKYQPTLKVFDLKTGKEVWKSDEKIFGTWLSYSVERDILIEAGRVARDSLVDEPMGMKAYRAESGKVVWYDAKHAGPAMIQGDTILMAGNACDLLTGKKKTRHCPLTGEDVEWLWTRNYGCNTPAASEHLMTFRSGAAGYYDLCNDGGTANLGGFRSSCTNNLIVANGVLSAPDYTRTCTCQYQNQTSLALIHMPEAEMWTFFGARQGKGLVKRFGINFGAPGDRRAENGTLWTEYPSVGGRSPMLTITTLPAKPEYIRHHASRVSGPALPWVACSAIKGLDTLTIETADKTQKVAERRFTVRLLFAELEEVEQGERVFDVSIQGESVLKGLDIAKEAGGKNRVLVKEVKGVKVGHNLVVKFTPSASTKVKESILGGIEVIEEEPQR